MAAVLDTLRFSQRLQQSGVSREQAEAHAEVARDMVMADLVTKTDLQGELALTKNELRAELLAMRTELSAAIRETELRMTIKLGAMLAAAVGLVVAAERLL